MPKPCPVTDEQKIKIVEAYKNGASRNSLALIYAASRPFINTVLDKAGVMRRTSTDLRGPKLALDETAFSNAEDSEDAVYWIGFLMADGCVYVDHAQAWSSYIILALAGRDIDHVRTFRTFLKSEHKLSLRESMATFGKQIVARLSISSNKIAEDLARYGVVPGKPNRKKVSKLEKSRHFWRGMIDGDGSLYVTRDRPNVSFVGSKGLCKQFVAFMREISDCRSGVNRDHNIWQCRAEGQDATKVIHELYHDCHVALPRKLAKAREMLERWPLPTPLSS